MPHFRRVFLVDIDPRPMGCSITVLLEPHVRAEAQDAQQRWQLVALRATELAAASTVSALAIPPMLGMAAVSGLIAALAASTSAIKGQIARDPPRPDFQSRTTLRRRKFSPGEILAPDEPRVARGIDLRRELAMSATGFGVALVEDDASERAFLRALERAAGAVDADREEAVTERLQETREFQSRAEVALRAVASEAAESRLLARELGRYRCDTAEAHRSSRRRHSGGGLSLCAT